MLAVGRHGVADVEGTGFRLETQPPGAHVFVDDSAIGRTTPVTVTDAVSVALEKAVAPPAGVVSA